MSKEIKVTFIAVDSNRQIGLYQAKVVITKSENGQDYIDINYEWAKYVVQQYEQYNSNLVDYQPTWIVQARGSDVVVVENFVVVDEERAELLGKFAKLTFLNEGN